MHCTDIYPPWWATFPALLKGGTNGHKKTEAIENCQPGDTLGIFKVYAKTDKEYILGENDKHLNFRASFLLSPSPTGKEKEVFSITTALHFNNAMGKMYFLPGKPFHGLIIRSTLKNME